MVPGVTNCLLVREGSDACLGAAEDEGMHVVRALIRIHHLEVDEVTNDAELVDDAVAAEHEQNP